MREQIGRLQKLTPDLRDLSRLDADALEALLASAERAADRPLPLDEEARASLIRMADGDGRYLITLAEQLAPLLGIIEGAVTSLADQQRWRVRPVRPARRLAATHSPGPPAPTDHTTRLDGLTGDTPRRLRERYESELVPALTSKFGYTSPMQVPRVVKVSLNMGIGDAKQSTPTLEAATEQLATITGQRPSVRRARKSIASFKVREGMPVGVAVTLRSGRMWEFLDRFTSIAVPRIRDFRGLNPRSFDGRGNFSLGVREQIIFPEIDYDAIDQVRGLDVTITTSAKTDEEAYALLRELGMPFSREGAPGESADAAEEA